MTGAPLSVLVPVRNEETRIGVTAAQLLDGLSPEAQIVFVLNGCVDRSETILRKVVGDRALIVTSAPGKAAAIREGERYLSAFPRFFVDADVLVSGSSIVRLAQELRARDLMLIAPTILMDLDGASWAMRRVHALWRDLPHAGAAFHHVLGVSEEGRRRWGVFPDLMADDSFMEAMIPPARCGVSAAETLVSRPPRRWSAFVRVRARWTAGQRQLARAGIAVRRTPGQRLALLRHMATRPIAGALYLAAYACASLAGRSGQYWYTDQTSR